MAQPNLDDIKKKVADSRDLVEQITAKLPGFGGYVEKAESYDADKIIRDFIGDAIQSIKNDNNTVSGEKFRKGETEALSGIESLNTNLERILKKVRSADFGPTGSQSHMKVTEEDKNRLLEYDWRLISTVDELKAYVDKVRASKPEETSAAVGEFLGKIREFEKAFDERKNIISEVM